MKLKAIKRKAEDAYKKSTEKVENSKLWRKFGPSAEKVLWATTLTDVGTTTLMLAGSLLNAKALALFYPYAFVKDLIIRPMQALAATSTGNRGIKRYVLFYYVANVATAFLYPVVPLESYIPLIFMLKRGKTAHNINITLDKYDGASKQKGQTRAYQTEAKSKEGLD